MQVGSNDGEQHDPLRREILRRDWHGIMIEPVPYVFARLQRNYGALGNRIVLENVAIGERDGTLPFYHLAPVGDFEAAGLPQWYDGIGSFKQEHVLKHVTYIPDIAERLVCTEVPSLTFESLCNKHGVERVDLIHIDAEGSDFDVVQSIDLQRHRPRLLIYEHYHLPAGVQGESRRYLEDQGYDTIEHGMDTWCLALDDVEPHEVPLFALWDNIKTEPDQAPTSLRRVLSTPTAPSPCCGAGLAHAEAPRRRPATCRDPVLDRLHAARHDADGVADAHAAVRRHRAAPRWC